MIESKFLYKYDILSPSISILFDTHGCSGKLSVSLFGSSWCEELLLKVDLESKTLDEKRN